MNEVVNIIYSDAGADPGGASGGRPLLFVKKYL
jgi:hypothetical protein